MANYTTLKAAITDAITTNGNNEITGALLQSTLLAMINSLGSDYQFAGVAIPTTNPGTPDQNVFYLASRQGVYSNFNAIEINRGQIGVLVWNGSWSKLTLSMNYPSLVYTSPTTTYNDDGSITFANITTFDFANNRTVHSINDTIAGHPGYTTYFVLRDGAVVASYQSGIQPNDILLLIVTSDGVPAGGALYDDYIHKSISAVANSAATSKVNQLPDVVFTSPTTTYNDDGSITFANVSIIKKNGVYTVYNINDTIAGHPGYNTFFVLRDGAVVASYQSGLTSGDIILLVVSSQGYVTGGWLYPDYIAKKKGATKTIKLALEMGAIAQSGAYGGTWNGKKYWRTGFYRCWGLGSFTFVTAESNLQFTAVFYDSNFAYLSRTNDYNSLTNGKVVSVPGNAAYFGITIRKSGTVEFPCPTISITGAFCDNLFAFNPRPSGGYQKLMIPVNVANANAADDETGQLQDSENIMVDYGLIALPEQYDPEGAPIRMIIYCHGAGINYSSSVSQFPSTDLLPAYWLSEGCAVMDIEGNPFNNTDEHGYMPQALQSYLAAYDWCIRHYNIRRDGIYLGGRSMGGGMVFEILQSRIPVIAACPVAPVCNELWWWEYMDSTRRAFCAEKMGFTGTAPTWTSQNPMSSAEWQYLQDNFDKLVKCAPFWRGIENLPNKTTLFGVGNVGTFVTNQDEADLYNSLHFKVKTPIKMFAAKDDTTVNYQKNCKLMYQMLLNAAQRCEMRYFPTGGHHFELSSDYLLATYVNTHGVTLENVPIVYVEMLQFWRRYELNY